MRPPARGRAGRSPIAARRAVSALVAAGLVALAAVVLVPALSHAAVSTLGCDRMGSRRARRVINDVLLPHVQRTKFQLPPDCPLAPANDLLLKQEEAKRKHTRHSWKCGLCGKVFKSENFLDKHLEREHGGEFHSGAHICLADYCDILHCDWFDNEARQKPGWDAHLPCTPDGAERKASMCESLSRRCFPPERGHTSLLLHQFFSEHVCGAHTCNRKERRRLLTTALDSVAKSTLFNVTAAFVVAGLIIFYITYFCYFSERRSHNSESTLRPVRRLGSGPGRPSALRTVFGKPHAS